jgi:putative FmdB family regulatory protein
MPIYEYECVACAARLEKKQRFDEEPLVECPECGERLRRVLHPAPILFQGSGWYSTDNKSSGSSS